MLTYALAKNLWLLFIRLTEPAGYSPVQEGVTQEQSSQREGTPANALAQRSSVIPAMVLAHAREYDRLTGFAWAWGE